MNLPNTVRPHQRTRPRAPLRSRTLRAGGFLAAALLVSAVAVWLVPHGDVPPLNPMGRQAAYRPADAEAQVLVEPWLHAPWRMSPPAAAGWVFGGAVALVAVAVSLATGATTMAAWLAVMAALASAPFAAAIVHVSDTALALVFVWASWGLAWAAVRRPDPVLLTGAVVASAVGVTASWMALAAVPVVLVAWIHIGRTPRARALALAIVLIASTTGLAAYVARTARLATAASSLDGATVSMADAWAGLFEHVARAGEIRFTAPDIGGISLPGIALIGMALVLCDWPRWWRAGLLASLASVGFIWMEWHAWRGEVLRLAAWAGTPLAAAGLSWAVSQAPARRRTPALAAIGIVLVAASLAAAHRPVGGSEPRAFARQLGAALDRLGHEPIALVAEDTLVDSAVAAWSRAPRLSQRPETVARAIARGFVPLAGPAGRRHLELFGYLFEASASFDDPVSYQLSRVVDRYRCATTRIDRWSLLPGVEYTGRLGLEIPPGLGSHLLLIVGDDEPPQLRGAWASGRPMAMVTQPLMRGPGSGTPPPDYWFDGGDPALAPQQVVRVAIAAHPLNTELAGLFLGRRAPRVLARLEGYSDAARGRVCAAPLGPDPLWADRGAGEIQIPLSEPAFFGIGWHGVEGPPHRSFRWTEGTAAVLVPSAVDGPVRVTLDAAPAATPNADSPTLTLRVNGLAVKTTAMKAGIARYEWMVPAGRWRSGTNELLFSVSRTVRPADTGRRDTRVLGLRVHGITLTH